MNNEAKIKAVEAAYEEITKKSIKIINDGKCDYPYVTVNILGYNYVIVLMNWQIDAKSTDELVNCILEKEAILKECVLDMRRKMKGAN